ncbi:MAG: hypothetical protein JXL80_14990 [Planctomycetes bacterium]|nr:hypothetical protein [Planctomycetota bacterium]
MSNRIRLEILLLSLAMLLAIGSASQADLPDPAPPQSPAARPKGLMLRRPDPPAANQWTNNTVLENAALLQGASDRLEADLLMKRIADPRLPMPSEWDQQVGHVARVVHVDSEHLASRTEELLLLLDNTTALRDAGSGQPLQVRHRAAAALSVIGHIWFGSFPTCGPDEVPTEQQQEQARRIAEQWRNWWQEAEPLDDEQRRELALRLRKPLLESDDRDLLWPNLVHAQSDSDLTALPIVGRMVGEVGPMDASAQRVISLYGNLCRLAAAPKDAALVLIDFMRKNNEPGTINKSAALRQATFYVQQASGVSLNYYKQVEPPPGEEAQGGPNEYIIDPEAIDAWEKAIKEEAEKPTVDRKADDEDDDEVEDAGD